MGKGKNNEELFRSMPVAQAILTLAVPTVVSQIITIIYNMADTFFIGQLGDPKQVAAATLAMPLFMFMTALSNLFGVGGASLISRFLGGGERKKASRCGAFCIWTATGISVLYAGDDPHSVCLQPWRGPGHCGASVYTGFCREQAVHQ